MIKIGDEILKRDVITDLKVFSKEPQLV